MMMVLSVSSASTFELSYSEICMVLRMLLVRVLWHSQAECQPHSVLITIGRIGLCTFSLPAHLCMYVMVCRSSCKTHS